MAGTVRKSAKPTILKPHEEIELLKMFIEKAQSGGKVEREDVISEVVKILKSDNRKNTFRNGIPGDKWFSLVRRRHNSQFMTLDKDVVKNLENVGFTEKVTNTVTYSPHFSGPIPRVMPKEGFTPQRRRRKRKASQVRVQEASPSPPPSDNSGNEDESQDSQPVDSSDFEPGRKLEVQDFNEKWYPVRVVEVDYEEGEVFVHFENWSEKYDEWIRMDSNRIRRPKLPRGSSSKKAFVKDERVLAVWAYNEKYPATVREVLPNDKYEVLFSDGYAKILRSCKLFKATTEELKNYKLPPPKAPAPPMGADPLDPNLGPKEERRLKKRRLDVLESYLPPNKRQRLDHSGNELSPQKSPPVRPAKEPTKPKTRPAIYQLPVHKREKVKVEVKEEVKEEKDEEEEEDDDNYENYIDEVADEPESEQKGEGKGEEESKKKRHKKFKKFDEKKYAYRPRTGPDEDPERWNTDIPAGALPVQITDTEGNSRESIIIPDKNLPPGWTKHTMRRKNGAKWDVFLVNENGRKFRSRNELRSYFTELSEPFPEDKLDFQVGRKMEMIRSQRGEQRKLSPTHVSQKSTPIIKKRNREPHPGSSDSKVKTLKESETKSPATPATPPFPISELRTPDGGYTCCGKSFRKENLFQMHMKHYHPEYSNLFGSSPNVADLAYARTVGEPLEDSRAEAMTPRSTLMERVNKYEADRKATNDSTVSADYTPGTKSVKKEKESVPQDSSEQPVTPALGATPEQPLPDEEKKSDKTTDSKTEDDGENVKDVEEKNEAEEMETSAETTASSDEEKHDQTVEGSEETSPSETPASEESQTPTVSDVQPPATTKNTSSLPVIKSVSKQSSKTTEAMIVQSTSSAKMPITITKCLPAGHKSTTPLTKLTISMTSTSTSTPTVSTAPSTHIAAAATEKVTPARTTIKTLLPMRPPKDPAESKDAPESTKKDAKTKDQDTKEEVPAAKTKVRKRTASDSLSKKSKLPKSSSASLEEEPVEGASDVAESPNAGNTSYRFSRNRSQPSPRVSLEKLTVTPDNNGRVVIEDAEDDKVCKTAGPGRRRFKNYKAENKINKRLKEKMLSTDMGASVESSDTQQQPLGNNNSVVENADSQETVYENLRKEEIINCTCGYMEEDGLMIQCDLCLCWQHGMCNNINLESDVPEKYVCSICQNPHRQRVSQKYLNNQDWLKEGKLPTLSFRHKNMEAVEQRHSMLKKSHDLTASLLQLRTVIRSMRVKTHIATKPDHPKLYLWAKSWKNDSSDAKNGSENTDNRPGEVVGPQPEAAIDETECRLRLLEHIDDYQQQMEDRLTSIQAQIAALESEDPDLANDEASDHCPVTKQTVQMIMRDLATVNRVAAIN